MKSLLNNHITQLKGETISVESKIEGGVTIKEIAIILINVIIKESKKLNLEKAESGDFLKLLEVLRFICENITDSKNVNETYKNNQIN